MLLNSYYYTLNLIDLTESHHHRPSTFSFSGIINQAKYKYFYSDNIKRQFFVNNYMYKVLDSFLMF